MHRPRDTMDNVTLAIMVIAGIVAATGVAFFLAPFGALIMGILKGT